MVPLNGSARARKPGGGSRSTPKPVVPAIPLPYIKRQAAADAAAAAVNPPPDTPRTESKATNGHVTQATNKPLVVNSTMNLPVKARLDNGIKADEAGLVQTNGQDSVGTYRISAYLTDQHLLFAHTCASAINTSKPSSSASQEVSAQAVTASEFSELPAAESIQTENHIHTKLVDAPPPPEKPEMRNGMNGKADPDHRPGKEAVSLWANNSGDADSECS